MYKSCIFMRFSTIFTVRSLKSLFELLRSLLLISLMSGPLKIWFCQFAHCASLFVSRNAITPKIKVRSRAKERFQRAMCPALEICTCTGYTQHAIFCIFSIVKVHLVCFLVVFKHFKAYSLHNFYLFCKLFVRLTYYRYILWKFIFISDGSLITWT